MQRCYRKNWTIEIIIRDFLCEKWIRLKYSPGTHWLDHQEIQSSNPNKKHPAMTGRTKRDLRVGGAYFLFPVTSQSQISVSSCMRKTPKKRFPMSTLPRQEQDSKKKTTKKTNIGFMWFYVSWKKHVFELTLSGLVSSFIIKEKWIKMKREEYSRSLNVKRGSDLMDR